MRKSPIRKVFAQITDRHRTIWYDLGLIAAAIALYVILFQRGWLDDASDTDKQAAAASEAAELFARGQAAAQVTVPTKDRPDGKVAR